VTRHCVSSSNRFPWCGDGYRKHGVMMPAGGLRAVGENAILFGFAGDPQISDHITLWGLRPAICQGFDQYAIVRPTRILPGIVSPLALCARAVEPTERSECQSFTKRSVG
jgi:tartrate dehydrogenase/decarboxylase/D-malate dehydrogenase